MRPRITLPILVLIALGALALVPPARADVQIQEKVTFDGFGNTGFGANIADTTMRLSGDRLQQESVSKMTGKMMKFVPGLRGSHTGTITRLDKGMLYTVDYEDKTYVEMSLAEMGASMEDALATMAEGPPPPSEGEKPPDFKCDPAQFSASNTGEKREIAGMSSTLTKVEGQQTCRNEETKESCTLSYALSVWNTPAMGGFAELQAFMGKQAKAMGFDMDRMRSQVAAAGAFFPGGSSGLESAMKELGKIEGYPTSTRFEVFAHGDCGAQTGGMDEGGSDAPEGSGASGMKKFFSKFKKKDESGSDTAEAKKTDASAPAAAPGRTKIFGMTSEVVSVSTGSVPAEHFEVPGGFKKKEWRRPS